MTPRHVPPSGATARRCGRCDRQRITDACGLCRRCVAELQPATVGGAA